MALSRRRLGQAITFQHSMCDFRQTEASRLEHTARRFLGREIPPELSIALCHFVVNIEHLWFIA
jgi:hypothetical protein